MVVVSYSGKEINAKLVYYGAGLSGKTTNLEQIYEAVPETSRGKMVSMKTQSDRTLFFDLLPLDLGEIMGYKTRFLLYTVPGQVFYNATRKLVLKGADAIVFVADSAVGKMDENRESLENLRTNLGEYGLRLEDIPFVIQYNKRDLPETYTIEELNAGLNPDGKIQVFEAVATQGIGVFETFRGISHLLMQKVTRELRRATHGSAALRNARQESSEPGPALLAFGPQSPAAAAPAAPEAPAPEADLDPRDGEPSIAGPTDEGAVTAAETGFPSIAEVGDSRDESGESEDIFADESGEPVQADRTSAPLAPARAMDQEERGGGLDEETESVLDYGRQVSLGDPSGPGLGRGPGGTGAAFPGEELRIGAEEGPPKRRWTGPSSDADDGSGEAAGNAGPAPAITIERTIELDGSAAGGTPAREVVVPVAMKRGTAREIVLRIVVQIEG